MTRPRSPRLVLSPLWLLVALLTTLALNTSPAAASGGPETRVRAIPTTTTAAVGKHSHETPGSVGCLRPSQPGLASGSCVATNSLATGSDEAVFWSGIGRGGDATAASWAAKNGGATLESTLAQRGIQLPVWDASNPSVVSAWRQASADFASGASGNVRVLQGAPRIGSVWAEVEYPTLIRNPNVTSITSINPATGEQVVLWTRP